MSAITKTIKYTVRMLKYLWFIKTYWLRQMAFDAHIFSAMVINGQNIIIEDKFDQAVAVNHYYTRYENTARAAK